MGIHARRLRYVVVDGKSSCTSPTQSSIYAEQAMTMRTIWLDPTEMTSSGVLIMLLLIRLCCLCWLGWMCFCCSARCIVPDRVDWISSLALFLTPMGMYERGWGVCEWGKGWEEEMWPIRRKQPNVPSACLLVYVYPFTNHSFRYKPCAHFRLELFYIDLLLCSL